MSAQENPEGVAGSQPRVKPREERAWRNPGYRSREPNHQNPKGVALKTGEQKRRAFSSIPDVAFIDGDTISLAELTKLILE